MDNILSEEAAKVAPKILGWKLIRYHDGARLVGRIVETEAYDQSDAASHSYRGVTPRTKVMFGPSGFAYVYFTYGMHYCFNVVTGQEGHGSAVLIRALEPLEGIDSMEANRGRTDQAQLTNGPAKLCQALKINRDFNGHNLSKKPLVIAPGVPIDKAAIVRTTRIGISKDSHRLWRFYIKDNHFVSKL